MANRKVREYRKVYNRKICRNALKFYNKTNKIKYMWKKLKGGEDETV